MIDFRLTENDEKVLADVRRQALMCREYARYYDEHEEEFVPDELEEAKGESSPYAAMANRTDEDSSFTFDVLADNGNGPDTDAENNIDASLTVLVGLPPRAPK